MSSVFYVKESSESGYILSLFPHFYKSNYDGSLTFKMISSTDFSFYNPPLNFSHTQQVFASFHPWF